MRRPGLAGVPVKKPATARSTLVVRQTIQASTDTDSTASLAIRKPAPDLVSGQPIYLHGPDSTVYLNPKAFALPAPGKFGNLKRGFVRQPGLNNIDFSVAKNWKIKERYGIQFRAEMFNLFNHTNFNGFDAGLGAGFDTTGKFTGFSNTNFGRLNSDRGPRNIQFGIKFNF
jgi:hypothetical protein